LFVHRVPQATVDSIPTAVHPMNVSTPSISVYQPSLLSAKPRSPTSGPKKLPRMHSSPIVVEVAVAVVVVHVPHSAGQRTLATTPKCE